MKRRRRRVIHVPEEPLKHLIPELDAVKRKLESMKRPKLEHWVALELIRRAKTTRNPAEAWLRLKLAAIVLRQRNKMLAHRLERVVRILPVRPRPKLRYS